VCNQCLQAIQTIAGEVCSICGERLLSPYTAPNQNGEIHCGLCMRAKPPFVKAVAYASYEGTLRELIQLLKYQHVRPAAAVLGRMLADAVGKAEFARNISNMLVVPVPLHRRKLRERGFNHCELIAEAALKLRRGQRLSMDTSLLKRRRETQSQTGLTRHQRRENVRGAFLVERPSAITGRNVLLIDDVFTTGTTVSECARTLLRAGASKVFVATVARTLRHEAQTIRISTDVVLDRRSMAAAS
jgi:ComF family protein